MAGFFQRRVKKTRTEDYRLEALIITSSPLEREMQF